MTRKKTSSRKKPSAAPPANAKETSERVKRPELPRVEPIRSWSTLFGADSGAARAQAAYSAGARTASDAVQRGVELGYRVVEEYLKQGTTAADAFAGPGRSQTSPYDLPQMTERMMRSAQDFSSMWFDMMSTMMSNMPGQAPIRAQPTHARSWTPGGSPQNGENERVGERWQVLIRVDSARPTEVTVTLDKPSPGGVVIVEPLRAATGTASIEVSLELSEDHSKVLRLRARVPSDLPVDRYTGAVLDAATGKPIGRVAIALVE